MQSKFYRSLSRQRTLVGLDAKTISACSSAYGLNYLIDLERAVIVMWRRLRLAPMMRPPAQPKPMLDALREFGLKPKAPCR